MLGAGPVLAQSPTGDGALYYRIGGAAAIRPPANPFATTTQIPASGEIGINYTCGQFDGFAGLTAGLNRVVTLLESIDDVIAAGLTVLPLYILQRANPGLYDLLQNLLLRAEELVTIATKTCEEMEREIAQGKNPFEEWIVVSRGTDWKTVIGSGGIDVVTAKEQIDANVGVSGVPWLCNERFGGEGQAPVRVVGDVTRAGWNILMNRASCAAGVATVASAEVPRLAQVWATPEAASEWTTEVVGDMVVRTNSLPSETRPGIGLLPGYEAEAQALTEALRALVDETTELTLPGLDAVSAPGVVITRQVLEAIRERDPQERELLIGKLAGEVALARTVERALLARRMLLTGQRDPNVNATPAPKQLEPFLAELERDIDDLLFETRVRKEMVSHTATQVLREEHVRRADSRSLVAPEDDAQPVDEGAVLP